MNKDFITSGPEYTIQYSDNKQQKLFNFKSVSIGGGGKKDSYHSKFFTLTFRFFIFYLFIHLLKRV